jgi:tRNA modification GTPase
MRDGEFLLTELRSVSDAPLRIAVTKSDLAPPDESAPAALAEREGLGWSAVSSLTGFGLDSLRAEIAAMLGLAGERTGGQMGLHARQRRRLLDSAERTEAAGTLLAGATEVADVAELVAVELRGALHALAEIAGAVTDEEVLGRIFERFCVGK